MSPESSQSSKAMKFRILMLIPLPLITTAENCFTYSTGNINLSYFSQSHHGKPSLQTPYRSIKTTSNIQTRPRTDVIKVHSSCPQNTIMTSVKPVPNKANKRRLRRSNLDLRNAMTDPTESPDAPFRGRSSAPTPSTSPLGDRVAVNRSRRSAFLRNLSRNKSKQVKDEALDENATTDKASNKSGPHISRKLSRKRSFCNQLMRQKSKPLYGSRAKTGPISTKAKERVLNKHPELGMSIAKSGDPAEELVFHGANSIKAEIIDMNAMIIVMEDNMRMLTHVAVERFFEWIPLFRLYLERYLLVEEDLIFRWVEGKGGSLKGKLSPAQRMMVRGRIQKELKDVAETRDLFVRHIPAGQRLSLLSEQVEILTNDITTFFNTVSDILPPILRERCTKSEISKSRGRIVRHVVEHVGYQDFLALYTRWMSAGDLLEWKTSVLLPCDFKFFSYSSWERDMDSAHYQIAASFGERMEAENRDDEEANRQSKMDFERARQTRLQLIENGDDAELADVSSKEDFEESE